MHRFAAALAAVTAMLAAAPATAAPFIPNDPGSAGRPGGWRHEQWNFAGPYGVRAPGAWANLIAAGRPGARGVTIAVLDTGVASSRRSSDFGRRVAGYDFVGRDSNPDDPHGHGTHVAATIAERTGNGYGLTGLAYGARVMPVRVLDRHGRGDASVIARGVRWAVGHGAKVINLSLSLDPGIAARDIPTLHQAIEDASRRGVLVVAAAGNDRRRAITYPARFPQVVAVGATTEHGCLARFSDVGTGLDIVAPGGGYDAVRAGDPRCRRGRPGRWVPQVTHPRAFRRGAKLLDERAGTSMAAAHVSAAAALVVASGVLGSDPGPAAIKRRLQATARDLGPAGYDTRYGWGLLNAAAATTR